MDREKYAALSESMFTDGKLVRDGPVTDAYWDARPRVLWILKEANAEDGGWSLCDFLANKNGALDQYPDWKRTFGKVAQVSWGLLHGVPGFEALPGGPDHDELRAALRQIAVVNISKLPGEGASVPAELASRASDFQALLAQQIEALAPDIAISGNVVHLLPPSLVLGDPTPGATPSLAVYEPQGGRLVLDAYHPAYWSRSQAEYYEEIRVACQVWSGWEPFNVESPEPKVEATWLADEVLGVLQDMLVHQRHKWGPLMGHGRHYEGWWKAEAALALESWAWRQDLPINFGVLPEAKPKNVGFGDDGAAADLLVAPFRNGRVDVTATPRVWIELKERHTWWGNVNKALGASNAGLEKDLHKWDGKGIGWGDEDIVVACHITTHEGCATNDEDPFPEPWQEGLDQHPRYQSERINDLPRIVGYPLGDDRVRWARMDFYQIHP